jgi:very-short-patch-repair endonuclease
VLVLVPATCRVRSRGWVQTRPTRRLPHATVVRGIALATVARAVADHALALRYLDDLRAITARAIQRGRCSLEQLAAELDAGPRNGSALLREALTDLGYGAWSAPEARAVRSLRAAGLGPFEQNARIIGPNGKTYVVDFLWRELRAILEVDSREHHFDEAEWKATQMRHRELETFGYSVIHMPPSEVLDEPRFIADVKSWLAGRADSRRRLINIPASGL